MSDLWVSDRLVALKSKLKVRKGKPGFEQNVSFIEAEIARLEKLLPEPENS